MRGGLNDREQPTFELWDVAQKYHTRQAMGKVVTSANTRDLCDYLLVRDVWWKADRSQVLGI